MTDLTDTLFHISWWVMAVIAIGGAGLFVAANRRLDKPLQRLGIALVLLAVILAGLRLAFPIARERMERRTRQLIKAVDRKDWAGLKNLLDANTAIGTSTQSGVAGRDEIVATTEQACDRYGVKSVSVTGIDSQQTQTLITVSVEAVSVQDATDGRPLPSSWQFDYHKSGEEWILEKITLLRGGQFSGDEMFNPFPR